jgi:hypothetical protein
VQGETARKASNVNTFSATSLITLLIPRLSFDIVHIHGLYANVTERKVSRHTIAEDLHGVVVTVAYIRALHLEARELAGKRPELFPKAHPHTLLGFATQHGHATTRTLYSRLN